jgi:peptidoglycan hydrolase-like protein with peptidoglycan-binding domain
VAVRGTLLLTGVGLKAGMTVVFPRAWGAAPSARISSYTPASRMRTASGGLEVTVPANAHSGDIIVLMSGGRHTSPYGPITVFGHALHPPKPPTPAPAPTPAPVSEPASASAFEGQGMWIWYLSKADGGSVASIVAQAHAAGVTTLFIKSSDGPSNFWAQFTPEVVAELHAAGLKVCAWQYVYGSEPAGEAELGAQAVADGADCLVIDAEEQYEGRYAAAQIYIDELRAKIGATYPLGLASFPYVFDHPKFPYSVFLGPGGAQFDAPQMYWKAIGNSVDTVYADTFIDNRIYGHPIFPLGQTYGGVSPEELLRFREEAVDYGSTGASYWDWQETTGAGWSALAAPLTPLTTVVPNPGYMELSSTSKGDPVLWMQEHLASAEPGQETTGIFSAQTATNLEAFQAAHGIAASGICEAATWQALLALTPVPVSWTGTAPVD